MQRNPEICVVDWMPPYGNQRTAGVKFSVWDIGLESWSPTEGRTLLFASSSTICQDIQVSGLTNAVMSEPKSAVLRQRHMSISGRPLNLEVHFKAP